MQNDKAEQYKHQKIKGRINEIDDTTQAEELQGFMRQFIEDVDFQYESKLRGGQ